MKISISFSIDKIDLRKAKCIVNIAKRRPENCAGKIRKLETSVRVSNGVEIDRDREVDLHREPVVRKEEENRLRNILVIPSMIMPYKMVLAILIPLEKQLGTEFPVGMNFQISKEVPILIRKVSLLKIVFLFLVKIVPVHPKRMKETIAVPARRNQVKGTVK